jgi:hypothetical protein
VVGGKTAGEFTFENRTISASVRGDVALVVERLTRWNGGDCLGHEGARGMRLGDAALSGRRVSQAPLYSWSCDVAWSDTRPTHVPAFYRATLDLAELADAFLDTTGLSHGVCFVNGNNVGSNWTSKPAPCKSSHLGLACFSSGVADPRIDGPSCLQEHRAVQPIDRQHHQIHSFMDDSGHVQNPAARGLTPNSLRVEPQGGTEASSTVPARPPSHSRRFIVRRNKSTPRV